MNEQQIACFLAVKNHLNFSRAADRLFITQPALSYQIGSLEKELDVRLFDRTTTSVRLTEAGLAFALPAEKLYAQFLEAAAAVRGYAGKKNRLVLICPYVMIQRDKIYRVMIARIVETFPKFEIEVRLIDKGDISRDTFSGGVDCAIGMLPPEEDGSLECFPLFQTRCYLVASPQHPFSGRESVLPAQLDGQILYYEENGRSFATILRRIAEENGAKTSFRPVPAYDSAYPVLVSGKGLFISPLPYEDFPQDWYIPVETDGFPPTVLICQKEPARPCVRTLTQIIRQVYRESMPPEGWGAGAAGSRNGRSRPQSGGSPEIR